MSTNTKLAEALRNCRDDTQAQIDLHIQQYGENYRQHQLAALRKALIDADEALAAHAAEQAQEPFAWIVLAENGNCICWSFDRATAASVAEVYERPLKPLYSAPVERAAEGEQPMSPKCVSGTSEQAAKAVPAGWKLVPVEPTEAMLRALTDPFIAINGDNRAAFLKAWKVMLAAAPTPPAPEAEPDTEAVTACWQDFGRTNEFRRAVKWSQDGDIPGALFVAFRAGLRAAPTPPAPEAQQAAGQAQDERAAFEAWFSGFRHGWKSEKDVASDAWRAALAQRREPLTDEQIAEGRYRTWAAEPDDAPEAWAFMRGARWAEKHFGIGATTGEQR